MKTALLLSSLAVASLSGCNGAFYRPDARVYTQAKASAEDVWFESGDGTRLHGWFFKARGKPRGTVLQLHGNAANVTAHAGLVAWLAGEGFNVFCFDYRGYGRSQGSPSRAGVHQDALAALRCLRGRADVDASRLLVFGQSLGGAVALAALADDRVGVRGLAVEGTFEDYATMGNEALGGTPVTWPLAWLLVSGDHDPEDALPRLGDLPLFVIHSRQDAVVPYARGLAVFEAAEGPKVMLSLARGRHVAGMADPAVRAHLVGFFDRCLPR